MLFKRGSNPRAGRAEGIASHGPDEHLVLRWQELAAPPRTEQAHARRHTAKDMGPQEAGPFLPLAQALRGRAQASQAPLAPENGHRLE